MASGVLFAEFHTLAGERQEGSSLVGVATSPVLSLFKRRRGQLFTVLEPSQGGMEGVCRAIIETVEDEYFRDSSRSVTSSLTRAIAMANERLRAENSRLPPDRQLRVGLSCAAIRDADVYVAQVAPGNAFIFHDGVVKRVFSSYSLSPEISGNGTTRASDSLGSRLDSHVNFGFSPLQEGDLIVLASGAGWKLIPDRYIIDAARHQDPDMAASDLYSCYLAHAQRPTTSMIVIRIAQVPGGHGRNGAGEEKPALPPAEQPRPPEPETRARLSDARERRRPSRSPLDGVETDPHARPQPLRRGVSPQAPPGRLAARETRSLDKPIARPTGWARLRFWDRGEHQGREPSSEPLLVPVGKPSVRLRGDWSRPRAERGNSPAVKMLLLVLLAAILAAAGWFGFNFWTSWQLGDPVALAQEAEQKRAASATAQDKPAARALLVQSYDLLQRAIRAKDEPSTRGTATAVAADIDRIDQTVRITKASTLIDFTALLEEKGDPTHLMVDGSTLYVMDEGLDRVYRYQMNPDGNGVQDPGKHEAVVKRGDKMDGATVGDFLALAWMPAGQLRTTAALFSLESGRSVIAYDPKGVLSRIEVAESQRWGTIQSISGFAGGLYLLDTKQKAVFYYPPTKNGYESQPYTIVDSKSKVDFSQAVDIALDGSLYVLQSNGAVTRFSREGRPQDFAGELPDGGMKGARSLFASAGTRSVYAVDQAGERIVQFSPEGKLQRQFKADGKELSFKDLRDIYVDEAGRKLYVLARKSLFTFTLPPVQ